MFGKYSKPNTINGVPRKCWPSRRIFCALALLWAVIATTLVLLWSCEAHAGRQVYLQQEVDLGNGYKQCIYEDGITMTVQSHRLCPLTIEV